MNTGQKMKMFLDEAMRLCLVTMLYCLSGCFGFSGMRGEKCTEQALCGTGLVCDEESFTCLDEATLIARYCPSVDCGFFHGVWCGGCESVTEACRSNRCVDVCEGGRRCGVWEGAHCGLCRMERGEVCEDNLCIGPCTGKDCGTVGAVSCGECAGTTEICESNLCVDLCSRDKCGSIQGTECGRCRGPTEVCESNRCVDVCEGGCGIVRGYDCGDCRQGASCQDGRCGVPGYLLVRAGSFMMGSPREEAGRQPDEEQTLVSITNDFWIKATEVTQSEYRLVMGTNPSTNSSCGSDCPVEMVSWFEAVDYVNALSRAVGLPECYSGAGGERTFSGLSCRGYRLPTEAEWEFAARAGTTEARYGPLDVIAWYADNSGNRTNPVRRKMANDLGLHDMIGNVREWTNNWSGAYSAESSIDPLGPTRGSFRVARGCGWSGGSSACRAAFRSYVLPEGRGASLGFRPARSSLP